MKDFGEFNIDHEVKGFSGQKISINSILNVNIIVEDYKTGPSKIKGKSERLDLQIIYQGIQRLVWVSSKNLIEMIKKVPKTGFPFTAKITVSESGGLKFIPADKN